MSTLKTWEVRIAAASNGQMKPCPPYKTYYEQAEKVKTAIARALDKFLAEYKGKRSE